MSKIYTTKITENQISNDKALEMIQALVAQLPRGEGSISLKYADGVFSAELKVPSQQLFAPEESGTYDLFNQLFPARPINFKLNLTDHDKGTKVDIKA